MKAREGIRMIATGGMTPRQAYKAMTEMGMDAPMQQDFSNPLSPSPGSPSPGSPSPGSPSPGSPYDDVDESHAFFGVPAARLPFSEDKPFPGAASPFSPDDEDDDKTNEADGSPSPSPYESPMGGSPDHMGEGYPY